VEGWQIIALIAGVVCVGMAIRAMVRGK